MTDKQIRDWRLPSRPTKTTDMRAAAFANRRSVELDAIEPNRLRELVRRAIERHLPAERLAKLQTTEALERKQLEKMIAGLGRPRP